MNKSPAVAYYTVADARFFPGLVGLLNSLRWLGEDAPLFVVDCGMTASQRERISGHVRLLPRHEKLHPVLQKATGPLSHPAEVMVVVDSDILLTRTLGPLFEAAANDRIVCFEDVRPERFFPEWGSLGLGAPRRRPYVNAGLLAFSQSTAQEILPTFVALQERLESTDTHFGGGTIANPFYFADQDILNALLCTEYDGRAERHDSRLVPVPPFPGLESTTQVPGVDLAYSDGTAPYGLHHILEKPWLGSVAQNAYSDLFTRLVTGPEAPLQLEARDLPPRLRNSRLAPLDRLAVSIQLGARRRFRGKLGLRPIIEDRLRQVRRASAKPGDH